MKLHIITPTLRRYTKLIELYRQLQKQTRKDFVWHICSDGKDTICESVVKRFKPDDFRISYSEVEREGFTGGRPRKFELDVIPDNPNDSNVVCFVDDDNEINSNYVERVTILMGDADVLIYRIKHEALNKVIPGSESVVFGDIDSLNFAVRVGVAKKNSEYWLQSTQERVSCDCNFLQHCIEGTKVIWSSEVLGTHKTPADRIVRINLGSGDEPRAGCINIDSSSNFAGKNIYEKVDIESDARYLSDFPDNSVDEIFAYHLLEHFDFVSSWPVLTEWRRVLKEGGTLTIETPDLLNICRRFVSQPELRVALYPFLFGYPEHAGHAHLFVYSEEQLVWTLQQMKFRNVIRMMPDSKYTRTMPDMLDLFLKIGCVK